MPGWLPCKLSAADVKERRVRLMPDSCACTYEPLMAQGQVIELASDESAALVQAGKFRTVKIPDFVPCTLAKGACVPVALVDVFVRAYLANVPACPGFAGPCQRKKAWGLRFCRACNGVMYKAAHQKRVPPARDGDGRPLYAPKFRPGAYREDRRSTQYGHDR